MHYLCPLQQHGVYMGAQKGCWCLGCEPKSTFGPPQGRHCADQRSPPLRNSKQRSGCWYSAVTKPSLLSSFWPLTPCLHWVHRPGEVQLRVALQVPMGVPVFKSSLQHASRHTYLKIKGTNRSEWYLTTVCAKLSLVSQWGRITLSISCTLTLCAFFKSCLPVLCFFSIIFLDCPMDYDIHLMGTLSYSRRYWYEVSSWVVPT